MIYTYYILHIHICFWKPCTTLTRVPCQRFFFSKFWDHKLYENHRFSSKDTLERRVPTFFFFLCVCVWKHLVTRCQLFRTRTSNFLSRGCKQHIQSCTNEDTEWCWWYHGWSPWRTCQIRDETMLRLVLLFRFSKLLLRTFDLFPLHVRLIFDASPIQFRSGFDTCPFHFLSQFTRPPLWRTTGWTT